MSDAPLSFSRLHTWLQCGQKGHQQYNLGFESGLVQSYNLLGTTVHSLIENIHDVENFWKAKPEALVEIANDRLDTLWRDRLGGKEELAFLKKFYSIQETAYEDTRAVYEKRTGKKSKAPWMTQHFQEHHKPGLDRHRTQLTRISRNLNLDAFEPLESIWKDSYKFTENYIRLIRQELYKPKEIISEVDFEKDSMSKMSFFVEDKIYPFRGKIDQVWIMRDGDIYLYDIKSGRKQWNEASVRNSDQLFLYAKWVLETYGKLPDKVGIIDVRNSKLTEWLVEQTDYDTFVKRITEKLRVYQAIQDRKLYYPAAGSPESFCSFCPVGRSNNCKFYQHTPT